MPKKHDWIPGNLNPEHKIKEKDAGHYNVLLRRILVPNHDPKHPVIREWVKCFRTNDYFRFFVNCDAQQKINYLEGMNVDGAELVHDPTLGVSDKIKNSDAPVPGNKTALTQKERLQGQAEKLNIKGWETMSVPKLRNAINGVK